MRYWLVLGIACLSGAAHAGEIALFNGKDLSGWTAFQSKTGPNADGHMQISDTFTVRDGVIHVTGSPRGYLRTTKTYTNYHLHVEWRWAEPVPPSGVLNSAVYVRVSGADRLWPLAYEIEIEKLTSEAAKSARFPAYTGDIVILGYDKRSFRSDPSRINPTTGWMDGAYGFSWKDAVRGRWKDAEKPVGEWNTYDLLIDRDRINITLNGDLVNEGTGAEEVPGAIALESSGTAIEFRNIRLTPIAL